jgi:hypothetical protein
MVEVINMPNEKLEAFIQQQPEPPAIKPFTVSPDELPYNAAYDAHCGTSHVPDERAKQEQQMFVNGVQGVYDDFLKKIDEGQKEQLDDEMRQFKREYIRRYTDVLRSRSRIVSTMIAGPSNFNVRKSEKANNAHQKKSDDFVEWARKAQHGIAKRLGLTAGSGIKSTDSDAVDQLKKKVAELEKAQEAMKKANAEYRRTKGDVDAMNVPDSVKKAVRKWKETKRDYMEDKPFPSYALTNNNANLKRYKQRLADVEKQQVKPTVEIEFDGGTYVDSAGDGRVQLFFDGKPDAETIAKLKGAGFKWARSIGAWQRQRTDAARAKAKEIVGIDDGGGE